MGQFGRFCWFIIQRFERNESRRNAAELTFVTLFAVVPLMTSGYVMLTWFPEYTSFIESLHDFAFQHFVPASGEALQSYLNGFSQQARKLTWIGLVILVFSAMSLMMTIEKSFNGIWGVKTHRVGRRLIFYWLIIFIGPILLGAAFLFSSYLLSSTLWLSHVDAVLNVNQTLIKLLPLVLSVVTLTAMYYFLPSTPVRLTHALIGGLFSSVVLDLCKIIFIKLVSFSPSYQLVYGAFAVVPLFLVWVYLAWCIVLLGAELVRAMPFVNKELQGIKATKLDWALFIFAVLVKADRGVSRAHMTKRLSIVNIDDWEAVLNVLLVNNWIQFNGDEYQLSVDLKHQTVGELSELLHGKRLNEVTVINENTDWFETLKPILLEIREQKKAALSLPISDLIQH